MKKTALDIYDDMPKSMKRYISNYGWHFSKAAYEYAVDFMESRDNSKVKAIPKEQVDTLLRTYGVDLRNKTLYDYVFLATLIKAQCYGSSFKDEQSIALFLKDMLEDDDTMFRKWVATMIGKGEPIDWDSLC